jgi:hypothetical protein
MDQDMKAHIKKERSMALDNTDGEINLSMKEAGKKMLSMEE